jgi:nucleoside-diphosphate-sugar epimerase
MSRAAAAPFIVNGCTGTGTSVADLARELAGLFGGRTQVAFNGVARAGDPVHLVGATRRLQQLEFCPQVGLKEGLSSVVAQWRQAAG